MHATRRGFLQAAGAAVMARRARPNVLWIHTDEQRPDSLGCYGSPWARSPFIDRLAREGAIYLDAYTPSPVCVPARSCVLTGRHASSLGVYHNQQRLRPNTPFLTWVFAEAGYRTASFGKKHYFCEGRQAFETEEGSATDPVVGATRYGKEYKPEDHDAIVYPGPQPWILGGRFPADISRTAEARNVDLALAWLSSPVDREPFFLRVSLNAPHTPVVVPKPYAGTMDPDTIRIPDATEEQLAAQPPYLRRALRDYQGSGRLTREAIGKTRRYYYERVAFLDGQVERLLTAMRKRNLLDNTIVAFVSDHGAHLGDHGLFQKQTFYQQVATVPYLFWYPAKVSAGRRFRTPVNTLSILPTLIELAGLSVPAGAEARSLAGSLREGREPPAEPVVSEIKLGYRDYRDDDRLVMIRSGTRKLFLFQDPGGPERFRGREEASLYDLETDPHESANLLAGRPLSADATELQAEIARWDRARAAGRLVRG